MSYNIPKAYFVYFCTRFHLYIHVYALLLQSRGLSLLQISTIESVVIGTIFLMEVPTGVIADRWGRKWSIAMSVFLLMCGELLFLFSRNYGLYLIMGAITGTGFAFTSGAMESLIYDSLPAEKREDHMKRVMGRYNSIGQIAFFLSPLMGGLIVGNLTAERFSVAIALTVLALFIGLLMSLTLKEPVTEWHSERRSARQIFQQGIGELRDNHALRQLVIFAALTTPFTGTLVTTLAAPYLAQNAVSPFMIGAALSIGSLLAAVIQHYAYRVEKWASMTLLTLLPGISYLLLALVAQPILAWLLIVWMYGTNDIRSPLLSAYQNALISTGSRATALSLVNMLVQLLIAVMAPLYAALAGYSLDSAFLLMGGVIILGSLAMRNYLSGAAYGRDPHLEAMGG